MRSRKAYCYSSDLVFAIVSLCNIVFCVYADLWNQAPCLTAKMSKGLEMQYDNDFSRQELHRRALELMEMMFAASEAELAKPTEQQATPRQKTLAALALVVRENIRAFMLVEEHMK